MNSAIRQPVVKPQGYRLDSEVRRLELAAFGYGLTKTVVEGAITWELPCGLDTGWDAHPRNANEALFCYFLRLFEEDLLTTSAGSTGPAGSASTVTGWAGWTEVEIAFTPPLDNSSFLMTVVNAIPHIAAGRIIFIEGLGWIQVSSITGNDVVSAVVIQRIASPLVTIPVGALVVPTGPAGLPGDFVLQVATPTITPESSTFEDTQEVTLACVTPAALIYYTLDGSPATDFSTLYTVPFSVSATTTVKAKAYKAGTLPSAEVSAVYTLGIAPYYWGNQPTDFLDPLNPLGSMSTVTGDDNYSGTYNFFILNHYWYFIMRETEPAPVTPNGFVVAGVGMTSDLAGVAEGYTDVDANGYPCLRQPYPTPLDPVCRIYRGLNLNLHAYTLTITSS